MPVPSWPQLPRPGQVFLDHVGWMVPDMAVAAGVMARLGLALTPYSEHTVRNPASGALEPSGTANRLAMLPIGYLEILTPVDNADTPARRHVEGMIARHTGVHLVACTVADAEADAKRLAAAGFRMQPTVHLRRQIEAESGAPAEVAFTVVRPAFEHFPEGRVQLLTHHTPDHMWQRRYLPAGNAIQALSEVVLVVDDPNSVASRFASFLGRPVVRGVHPLVQLDRGRLVFMTRSDAVQSYGIARLPPNPSVAVVQLISSDLAATRAHLLAQGLRPGALGREHLLIDAVDALGVTLEIVP
jgi:hypothetical protein